MVIMCAFLVEQLIDIFGDWLIYVVMHIRL